MDYDTKLGEWFKEVERRAEQLRARKTAEPELDREEPVVAQEIMRTPLRRDLPPPIIREPEPVEQAAQVTPSAVAVDVAETPPRPAEPARPLFDEAEAAPVEDFLSFLDHSRERPSEPVTVREPEPEPVAKAEPVVEAEPVVQAVVESEPILDQGTLGLGEGTGIPRPIQPDEQREEPIEMRVAVVTPPAPVEPAPPPAVAPVQAPAQQVPKPVETAEHARFPRQLQSLLESAQEEVAQHSYKSFRETRAGLIHRLLDPPISLEEAARILNVCPTTVRRYTNRGVLKHFRTAGNQRRFRLSDVLGFLETQMGKGASGRPDGSSPTGPA